MTEYEAYQEHIRYTHDTYCRIVIRHASFDAARMLAARWKLEISLEYLTEEKFVPLSTIDEYFQVPDYRLQHPDRPQRHHKAHRFPQGKHRLKRYGHEVSASLSGRNLRAYQ